MLDRRRRDYLLTVNDINRKTKTATRTLSAIYSQLGNAYFYLGEYNKAMQFHKLDLTLARSMNDRLGEAKSSGNLGNTLKVMGRFEEAVICCERHLTIVSRPNLTWPTLIGCGVMQLLETVVMMMLMDEMAPFLGIITF